MVFYQHMMSGIRHLVMDTGQALEVVASKRFATATMIGSVTLTAVTWAAIYSLKGL